MPRQVTRTFCSFVLALAGLAGSSVFAENAGTTRTRFAKFSDDLVGAWNDFPKDTQKSAREQRIIDVNTLFSREVNTMDVPATITIQKALDFFVDNVVKTRTLFKFDKMQTDRMTYIAGCTSVLRREVLQASDYKTTRTTQQCFQLLLEALVNARDELHNLPNDLRQPAYQAINSVIVDLFQKAVPPEKSNPAEQMDQNIKTARTKFPTTNPDLEATNHVIYSMLEAAAKQLEQQAMRGK